MTINGINIDVYGASQHHVEIGYHDIASESSWVKSAILPHFGINYIDFKNISVDVIVKPLETQSQMHPRDAIRQNISNLLASLLAPADVILDNVSHYFKVILRTHKVNELVPRRFHKLTLEFIGYEYGDEVSASGTGGQVTIVNPGNILSPLRLTITTQTDRENITINGCCVDPRTGEDLPVILETTTGGLPIILDGANGLFTEGDEYTLKGDIIIKTPPGITHGEHTITCSATGAALEARVLPLYM